MTEVHSYTPEKMSGEKQDSPEKYRERRRRRIERRRLVHSSAAGGSSSHSAHGGQGSANVPSSAQQTAPNVAEVISPVVGLMSVAGRLRDMEDAVTVWTNLCRPVINRCQPVHFFGVYDGHGGPHVAAVCKAWMHVLLQEELMHMGMAPPPPSESGASSSSSAPPGELMMEEAWRRALKRCFQRMDELVMGWRCRCGGEGDKCSCEAKDVALSGSTALVVILTQELIIVANSGDSRAVLSRQGMVVALSFDHKPDRADERARIEAYGGRVIYNDGARVEGILATSRAIGDKYLKPFVTSEPEIFITRRNLEDECLILASDGLWDVMSNDMVCEVARECLREERSPPSEGSASRPTGNSQLFPTQSASAAGLLARLALGRQSFDNISVIVVDLKRCHKGG